MTREFSQPPDLVAAPPFGVEAANTLRKLTLPLDAARTLERAKATGTFLWAIQASSRAVEIEIAFNDQRNDTIPVREGTFIRGLRFDQFFITSSAVSGGTITLIYGVESADKLEIVNPASQFDNITIVKAATLTSTADKSLAAASTTQIAAANTNRREIFIHNLITNTQTMRVGDSNAGATRGQPLAPGDTIVLETTAAVHAYNPGGSAESVTVIEVTD